MKAGDVLAERYRLVERLGEGGMGEVWRAEQTALGRLVALKLVRADFRGISSEATERFRREAELVARVEHRNVVDVVDYGAEDDGTQYLVMPLLTGETLLERVNRDPRPTLRELLTWIRGVLGGLAAIHAKGIVHRDLKPANVFLARDDDGVIPKLIDFGISRPADAKAALTAPGGGMGTPQYMAPEQFESARDVDARADVWGVGAMLYEALSGRRPYEGDDAFAIYRLTLERGPTPLSEVREDLAPSLVSFVMGALSREPAERYADAAAMRDALDALLASATLPRAALEVSVVAGARVPQTAAMVEPSAVSADAPTELANVTPTQGPIGTVAMDGAGVGVADTTPTDERRGRPLLIAGVALLALGAVGWLVYDMLERPGRAEVAEPVPLEVREPDAASPPQIAAASEPEGQPPPADVAPDTAPPGPLIAASPHELTELALAWSELGADARVSDVRFAQRAGQWALVVPGDAPDALRDALGPDARPFEGADVEVRPALMRSTVRLSVHTRPDARSPVVRVLPHHAVVVAVAEVADEGEEEGRLRRVIVSAGTEGWVSRRFLEPLEGCLPDLASVTQAVGQGARDIVQRATRVLTHARVDGRRQDILLVAGSDLTRHTGHVRVFRRDPGCAITRLGQVELTGAIDELFLTETIPGGGQTLIVTSTAPPDTRGADGVLLWQAHTLDGGEALWSERLATGPGLPSGQRASVVGARDRLAEQRREPFVLAVRRPGEERAFYVYADGAIVPADAE